MCPKARIGILDESFDLFVSVAEGWVRSGRRGHPDCRFAKLGT